MKMPVAICFLFLFASSALAESLQSPLPQGDPDKSDVNEVDDIPGDNDYLPADSSVNPQSTNNIKKIEQSVEKMLEKTDIEIRNDYSYGAALMRGTSAPWEGVGLDMHVYVSPLVSVGLIVGSGNFEDSGETADRSYEMSYKAKSVGLAARRFLEKYDLLSFQLVAGYALWEGQVVPSGSDDLSADDEKLTSSFEANGWYLGVSLGFNWFWENGYFVSWEPIGIQTSGILQLDKSRDSESVENAVDESIETTAFYGISNIKIGILF
jgi:hypothetical protein